MTVHSARVSRRTPDRIVPRRTPDRIVPNGSGIRRAGGVRLLALEACPGDNEEVIPMDSAQVWTVIGVLSAGLFGMMTLMSTMFLRVLRAEIGSVRAEIGSVRTELGGEIGSLRNEMNARLDGLDRDVQFLMRREADRG
ncbi:hypothetical protein GCM10010921_08320 [Microbacterium album]|uniref:Uncharacterized protein n=2 Tax=Microbacterium album TaxID=2053191 RepID=A0A917IDD4_9MICO|nr:hypothetical protein GCM10010921_08320 [Microbacterium album]